MRPSTVSLIAAVALIAAAVPAAAERIHGCRAIDGDTLACGAERIHLRGVHAPALHEPGGPEARARLDRLLSSSPDHHIVRHGPARADLYTGSQRVAPVDVSPRRSPR